MSTDASAFFDCREVLEVLPDGICVVDASRTVIYWNTGAERITGYPSEDMLGAGAERMLTMHRGVVGEGLAVSEWPVEATLRDSLPREAVLYFRHKDGHWIPVRVRTAPIRDVRQAVVAAIEILQEGTQDITLQNRLKELERMALFDPLTGVANRQRIDQHLECCLDEQERYGWPFGLIFVDIDHFKQINDTYGHGAGDDVLRAVSANMVSHSRSFDLVGRWGGDEFVTVCRNCAGEQVQVMAERHRRVIEQAAPQHGQQVIRVTASLGATMLRAGDQRDRILERADHLMYLSKTSGGNKVCFAV